MRDIYLIDFENVASEGLSGITYLAPEDEVIIFYSNNSKSLSMKMHILIGKSVCKLDYFEAAVGGKNALDHQISTWLGYLIGTNAAERNYYIVSRDMGYKFVASFWSENEKDIRVRCVDSIKAAGRIERNRQQQRENALKAAKEALQQEAETATVEEILPAEAPAVEAGPAPVEETVLVEAPAAEAEYALEESADPVEEPAEEKESAENQQTRSRSRRNRHSRGRRRGDGQTTESKQEAKQETAEELKQEESSKAEEKSKPAMPARGGRKEEGFDLSALLIPYPNLQEEHLKTLIAEKKKQILCNTLRKQLGQEKGLALYNEIKRAAWR